MDKLTEKGYFAYLRESVDLKTGIELQREKIKQYSEAMHIPIIKWFIDNDASAFKVRPKYENMMQSLFDNNNAIGIICTNLTRFGRNTIEILTEHNKLKEHGKQLILIENNIDTSTTSGEAMFGMLAVFAKFERDSTKERITAGRNRVKMIGKTKSGLPMNRPPIQVDWKEYDKYHNMGLGTSAISKLIVDIRTHKKISKSALYKAVKNRIIT